MTASNLAITPNNPLVPTPLSDVWLLTMTERYSPKPRGRNGVFSVYAIYPAHRSDACGFVCLKRQRLKLPPDSCRGLFSGLSRERVHLARGVRRHAGCVWKMFAAGRRERRTGRSRSPKSLQGTDPDENDAAESFSVRSAGAT